MLDGASRLDELVECAVNDSQKALGITDHGNMYGVLDFYKAAKDVGVKPIIGSELYQAYDSRTERPTLMAAGATQAACWIHDAKSAASA